MEGWEEDPDTRNGNFMTLVETFAQFIDELEFKRIPPGAVEKARLCLIDSLANILGSQQMALGKRMIDFVSTLGGASEVPILGTSVMTSRPLAAFANGALFSTLGAGDGFTPGGNHPGGTVFPVAYALWSGGDITGRNFLAGVIAGYEVTCRIASGIHPSHTLKGFNPTGTIGTIGAAATAAKLGRLPQEKITQALGMAGFLMPLTPYETIKEGFTVMSLNCGYPARVGLESMLLAQHGFSGDPFLLEGRNQNGICNLTSDRPNYQKMVEDLGRRYICQEVYLKPYPAVRPSHGPADAILAIFRKNPFSVEEVAKVTIFTYKTATQFVRSTDPRSSPYACRMSIPYVLAATLLDRELGPRQFEESRIKNPRVHELAKRIEIREKREYTEAYPAHTSSDVEVVLRSGEVLRMTVPDAKGDPGNPYSPEEVWGKFDTLVSPLLGERRRRHIRSLVKNIENLSDMKEMLAALAPEKKI